MHAYTCTQNPCVELVSSVWITPAKSWQIDLHPQMNGGMCKAHLLICLICIQILLSEVREDPGGVPTLRRHGFRVDAEYFYPASSVKLCGAIAALKKVAALRCET